MSYRNRLHGKMFEWAGGSVQAVREKLHRAVGTELPCGCVAIDGGRGRLSNATAVVNREFDTVASIEYRNCTKYEIEWLYTVQCKQCGATWEERGPAGTKTAYGEENPGSGIKLVIKRRWGRAREVEVPIVERGGDA